MYYFRSIKMELWRSKHINIIIFSFLKVCEGLAFLHDSVKMIHRNISLGSIILNEAGAWKIFGFDFCLQVN